MSLRPQHPGSIPDDLRSVEVARLLAAGILRLRRHHALPQVSGDSGGSGLEDCSISRPCGDPRVDGRTLGLLPDQKGDHEA